MDKVIRAIIQSAVEGVIKRFTASGRTNETIEDREYMQHYGFTSMPQPGAEGVVIHEGNHYIMVATDDRRYRIPVVAGEVCIYTDEGDSIHFERGRIIAVTSGAEVDVTAPVIKLAASTSVTINTPLLDLQVDQIDSSASSGSGNVGTVGLNVGTLDIQAATAATIAAGGNTKIEGRNFLGHEHSGVASGSGDTAGVV